MYVSSGVTAKAICSSWLSLADLFRIVNPSKSSTFDDVGQGLFDISYEDEDKSTGDYFTDVFTLGSTSINNFTMGLGKKTTVPYGLIGVGYANNEASTETANTIYPNLPVAMQRSGLINSIAYSLWLNDLDASSGSVIFGGIDTTKYVGTLTKIPVLRNTQANNFTHFVVSMYSLEATSPSGSDALTSDALPLEVVLDSGTTLTYLPFDMATQIWDEVGAVYDPDSQAALIPCSYSKHDGHFSFTLGGPLGPRVNVTMDELVLAITDGESPRFQSGPYAGRSACAFGIQNTTESPYLLGDTFLRSAYVVYDLVNNEIGLAATNFNSTGSNIVAFPSDGAAIPSATPAPANNQSTAQPQPTSTGQSAAKGFQEDNASSSTRRFSTLASAFVGILILYKFMDTVIHVY